ncbi:MAG: amino acid permease [Maledivibacter sp.]|jgi:APA family basic amino acid/polyamine antiporter|nr:amino acid permease [Maledivibacter sp.]
MNEQNGLKKELSFFTVLMLVIGIVIGSGVFYKPHALYTATNGAPGLGILAWIVGGILALFGALTAAELSAAIPKTGGMIPWIREGFGDVPAYLLGWSQTVVTWPSFIAALGVIFGKTAIILLGVSESWSLPIAICAIVFLISMNCISTKLGGQIGSVSTVIKLIPLIFIIIIGLVKGPSVGNGAANLLPFTVADGDTSIFAALCAATLATLYAYQGWIDAGALAGEMKNPSRDLPLALTLGLSIIMTIYIAINIAYLFVLPASHFVQSETPAMDVAKVLFGETGGTLINVAILISVFGALNANIMAGIRAPYTLAIKNQLPFSNWLKKVNEKTHTPINCGIYMAVVASIYASTGGFDFLTNITVVTTWIFYIVVFLAVIKLRITQPELNRPYRVPLYPIIPIIAIVGGAAVVFMALKSDFSNNVMGIVITLLGLPVYYVIRNKFVEEEAQ